MATQAHSLSYAGCNFLRQRLVLSTLSGRPVKIRRIRARDDNPGLRGDLGRGREEGGGVRGRSPEWPLGAWEGWRSGVAETDLFASCATRGTLPCGSWARIVNSYTFSWLACCYESPTRFPLLSLLLSP